MLSSDRGQERDGHECSPPERVRSGRSARALRSQRGLALRLSDGSVAWRFGKGRIVAADARAYGTTAVKDGVVYVAEYQGGLVGLDASDGNLRWEGHPGTSSPRSVSRPSSMALTSSARTARNSAPSISLRTRGTGPSAPVSAATTWRRANSGGSSPHRSAPTSTP
ncbi:PQQ-binding-like beta-propeller repeat protein [Streptomyces sp. NBC_00879]|uniref:outer membrane protein assembly factor BamB family protein n=1 Tax=Streptomyces sp. NBC_00879 TaxID=2975855 RepID=UPI003866B5EA